MRGGKRFFAFEKYPNYMPSKLTKNIEFIYGVRKPDQIEFIESLNKYLVLNSADKKLSLYNYGDNSLAWERKYNSEPLKFVYSKENNLIYLELSNKEVLALDPASGNGEKLFSIPASEEAQAIAPTNAGCLVFFKETGRVLFYNSAAKKVKLSSYELLYKVKNAVYNFYNDKMFVITQQDLISYDYNSAEDTLLMSMMSVPQTGAGSYISYALKLNAEGTKLFIGTGSAYACTRYDQGDYDRIGGDLNSFEDLAVISENSVTASIRSHARYISSYTGGVMHGGLYLMNGVLHYTNQYMVLSGQPLEIIIKDGIIVVFSDYNGILIIEKYSAADLSHYPEA
ncbi:MAG TPA: hypothetical protein VHO28_10680 [Ignavibacteriales bacterium]|nr:hypothetical protein [Ignavibacteriales bacterium]